jgi:hypothetical protein
MIACPEVRRMQPPPKVNHYEFPPELYVAKGVITLSPKALMVARQFVGYLREYDPKARWIADFQWCTARSMSWTADSEMIDEGPGIDLAGFRYGELPTDTVEIVDGVPVIFLIPPDVVVAAKTKTMVETRTNSGRASFALE